MCTEKQGWTVQASEDRCKFAAVVLRRIANRIGQGVSYQDALYNEADLLDPTMVLARKPREWWVSPDTNFAYGGPTGRAVHVREVL